jgi:hypothetical protein
LRVLGRGLRRRRGQLLAWRVGEGDDRREGQQDEDATKHGASFHPRRLSFD